MQTRKKTGSNNAEVEYTKAQIKQANLFPGTTNAAIINAAIDDNRKYTITEAKKAIEDFKGGI